MGLRSYKESSTQISVREKPCEDGNIQAKENQRCQDHHHQHHNHRRHHQYHHHHHHHPRITINTNIITIITITTIIYA